MKKTVEYTLLPQGSRLCSFNSSNGFVSYFEKEFSGLERLFILKGGPGTGKSYLMKKVMSAAVKNGNTVIPYHCSSDPESLDGIIIKELSTGIIDGTSPHTFDPRYPGSNDRIINLGDFWSNFSLEGHKDEIISKTDKKKQYYSDVYKCLEAYDSVSNVIENTAIPYLDINKMKSQQKRATEHFERLGTFDTTVYVSESLSMNGPCRTHPRGRVMLVIPFYGLENIYLMYLHKLLLSKGIGHMVSYSPYKKGSINEIYIESRDITVTASIMNISYPDGTPEVSKYINMKRFVDVNAIRRERPILKRFEKIRAYILSEACDIMRKIKCLHFELEDIYSCCMDFTEKEKLTNELIYEIFG